MDLNILYEDSSILVCVKKAGIATQSARPGEQDMVTGIKNYLVRSRETGRDPYLGVIHRLDQPTAGLLVFAKTAKAAGALSGQIREGIMNKDYLALCTGNPAIKQGILTHYLERDPVMKKAVVTEQRKSPSQKKAVLSFQVEEEGQDFSLVRIHLETGRFHQIRAQFSRIGHPLVGDVKYGGERRAAGTGEKGPVGIALCACRLAFHHPTTGEKLEFAIGKEELAQWYQVLNGQSEGSRN